MATMTSSADCRPEWRTSRLGPITSRNGPPRAGGPPGGPHAPPPRRGGARPRPPPRRAAGGGGPAEAHDRPRAGRERGAQPRQEESGGGRPGPAGGAVQEVVAVHDDQADLNERRLLTHRPTIAACFSSSTSTASSTAARSPSPACPSCWRLGSPPATRSSTPRTTPPRTP